MLALRQIAAALLVIATVIAGLVASPCQANPQEMLTLMRRITALAQEGRYGEAVSLARRLTAEAERAAGRQSPVTAMTLVVLGQTLQAQGELAEAEQALRKALVIREKALGPGHPDVAAVLATLGQIALSQNRLEDAERDTLRAISINEASVGPKHISTALARLQLGNLRHRQLRDAEALDLFSAALEVFRNAPPEQADLMVPTALNNIAEIHKTQGRLQQAEARFLEALAIQEKRHGRDNLHLTATLNNLGELKRMQGRLPEAEQLARRALAIREKALGANHPDVAASLNNLAIVFTRQGRASEAEGLLVRALAIHEKAYGPDHPTVATALNNLADARAGSGKRREAEALFRRSLAIREKSLGANHLDVAITLDNLVTLIVDDERYGEAEDPARRSLTIREAALGKAHPLVANSLNNLAVVLDSLKRPNDAEPLLKRALEIRLSALGDVHPDVANSLSNLGAHYLDAKDWQQAHDAFARASAVLAGRSDAEDGEGQAAESLKTTGATNPFPGSIIAAHHLAETSDSRRAGTLRADAFEAAQRIGDEQAANAIAGMSARVAAGNGDLSARVRERQDLGEQASAIDRQLIAVLSQPNAARNPQTEQALRTRASAVANQIRELDRAISAQFPEFAGLVSKAPVSIEEAQKWLKPNEALLLFTTTSQSTYVWTVSRTGVRWHAAPIGAKQLADTINVLRCGLDQEAWTRAADACAQKLGIDRQPSALPFDLGKAHELYQALLAPVANDIEGKELILVPSGPLATLPFQVLLTDKPASTATTPADLVKAPWLVKRFATTVLPSVSSLKALRQNAQRSRAAKPFIGFGNPLLGGGGSAFDNERAAQAKLRQTCEANPELRTNQVAERGTRAVVALSGGTADLEQLKRLAPLPETAIELCLVANSFAPVKGDVLLGQNASEAAIKSLSDSGRLQQYRMLHFATHGALAGQVRGSIEPGLIMTPPANSSPADDGYLTTSEISALKLNADWVVLSACNTAGGDAANSEAFSGLARAFFYAGTRALLVSHWPVNSDAAVLITTGATGIMTSNPAMGPAEALRRSVAALAAKGGHNAHPSAWAPFVLVGNGSL